MKKKGECTLALSALKSEEECGSCGLEAGHHKLWCATHGVPWKPAPAKKCSPCAGTGYIKRTKCGFCQPLTPVEADSRESFDAPLSAILGNSTVEAISDVFGLALRENIEELERRVAEVHKKWGAFASAHEAHSVILEKFDELQREVFREKKKKKRLRAEALDIATAALRLAAELDAGFKLSDVK